MDKLEDVEDTSTYIFLNFNDKLPNEVINDKTFLRIANLHKEHPLIQINDLVFKGKYDYSIGTNLFFEEYNGPGSPSSVFERKAPIDLKFLVAQNKVIHFKQAKIAAKISDVSNNTPDISYNFNWDYNELLRRFEEGTLDLKDLIKNECEENSTSIDRTAENKIQNEPSIQEADEGEAMDIQDTSNPLLNQYSEDEAKSLEEIEEHKMLEIEYEKLQMLARQPMRTKTVSDVFECNSAYKDSYEYKSIECKVLQPPLFQTDTVDLNEETFFQFIDLERCCRIGLLQSSKDFPRKLTTQEKQKILRFENFDNLALQARYVVLRGQMEKLEAHIMVLQDQDLTKVDAYGHTPKGTLETLKKLISSLEMRIQQMTDNKIKSCS